MRVGGLLVTAGLLLAAVSGCIGDAGDAGNDPVAPQSRDPASAGLAVTSPAFEHRGEIPEIHACDGEGISPPLALTGAPAGTVTLALISGDPDAPHPLAATMNFTHWVAWNIPVTDGGATFPEGDVPAGTEEGENGGGSQGWTGPCPPHPVQPHRYYFTVFAVDAELELPPDAAREELEAALDGHVLDEAVLMGVYDRTYGVLPPG